MNPLDPERKPQDEDTLEQQGVPPAPELSEDEVDEVQEASEGSFPASDPPSWTTTTAGGPKKRRSPGRLKNDRAA